LNELLKQKQKFETGGKELVMQEEKFRFQKMFAFPKISSIPEIY